MDFKKYKNSLKQYLKAKGYDPSNNPMYCFSPSHNNKDTPACLIYDDNFKCESGSCGIHGDIYDACGILTGITEKAEQYKEVEKTLLGYNQPPEKKKQKTKIDPDAEIKLISYLKKHGGREKGVLAFLKKRGYPCEIIKKMAPYFGYWPGFEIAEKEIGKEILKKSGVPLIHPKKNYSSWHPSGVIVKLNKGLKLCYYRFDKEKQKDICEKRNTKNCQVFPGPWKINQEKPIILVEAEITAIAMRALGFENVIPTGGTNGMSIKSMIEYLFDAKEIIFAFDGDGPGRKASCIIKQSKDDKERKKPYPDLLVKNNYKGIIKIAYLPNNQDPDDLIQKNKINELKKIIQEAKIYKSDIKKITHKENVNGHYPFFFLGYDNNKNHYVLPKRFYIPIAISMTDNAIKNMMKAIAPWSWWYNSFQKEDSEGNVSFDMFAAIEWFHEKSAEKGMYNDESVLGIGAYKDGEKIVFNTGDCLIVDDKKIEYENYKGQNTFTRSKTILKMEGTPWSTDEGLNFINQLKTFRFENSISYIIIAGYVGISPFSSLLKKRPHIWITAKSKTGKTTLLTSLIVPLVGKKQALHVESIGSEAFFRQKCKKDCRVPVIDEFEAYKKEDIYQQDKYFHFMRSAYSGALAGKGTPHHEPIEFNIKLMFCLSSVNTRFEREADRSRFVICNMLPKKDGNLVKTPENPIGLKLRIFKRVKYINQYIEKAKEIMIENGHGFRTSDTYAPFLAGFWMIVSDNHFFEGDEWLQKLIIKKIKTISSEEIKNDEDKILDHIFKFRIRIDPSLEYSVSEMLGLRDVDIENGGEKLRYDKQLRRYGLRLKLNEKEILAIDTDHPEIRKILKDTPFQEYREILQRHSAVIEKSKVVYMAGKNTRCIIFSWEKLYKKYFEEKGELPF